MITRPTLSVSYDKAGDLVTHLHRLRPIRLALLLAAALGAWGQSVPPATPPAQNPPPATPPPADPNQPEMATKDSPATFKTRVNLVMVPVVVPKNKGKAFATLHMEDFTLSDRGKPQVIVKFPAEKSGPKTKEAPPAIPTLQTEDQTPPPDIPERFIAYVFDDQHLQFGDLVRSRDAAIRHLASLQITDRAAVYTTSGQDQLEFTDDKDKLRDTMMRIRPRSIMEPGGMVQCPDISYYMADMILNKSDSTALNLAAQEVMACSPGTQPGPAAMMAQGAASRVFALGSQESRVSLLVRSEEH